jgi:two-component system nitrate/nitrite response regulator NarL
MTDTIRTLIIDDHPLFRKGVIQLLGMEPEFEVVAEASSGDEGVTLALELNPDLILLDLNMKGLNGIETLQVMREKDVDARIIILTVSNSADDLVGAIRAGSDGYILKDTAPEEMVRLIKDSVLGKNAISAELSGMLATALRQEAVVTNRSHAGLTERELSILKCLAHGMSNKLIARDLDIMDSTVKVHIRNLLKKLKFRSRVEAAVWAVSNNLG